MTPNVSIIMPAYNAERYIESAVLSVINQTYSDFELIVVEDCSKDTTYQILTDLAKTDSRIKLFRNDTNSGASYSRNFGVSKAEGEWIAFLDSDDMWLKEKLEIQMSALSENPDAVISYTASSFIDENGNPFSYVMPAEEKMTYKMMLRRNLMSCSSVVVKKDVFNDVKMGHDKMHEDYTAWLQILKKHPYALGINKPLLVYRMCENSKSSNRIKSAKMLYNSYRYVGYNPVAALFRTLIYSVHSISKRNNIKKNGC